MAQVLLEDDLNKLGIYATQKKKYIIYHFLCHSGVKETAE